MAGTPPAQYRIDGAYGEAYRDGNWLADVIEVSGTITVDRREVPMAGEIGTHYKRGRVTREGTIRFQQIDDRWHREFMSFSSLSLTQRRAARNAGTPVGAPFSLLLRIDDPEAAAGSSYSLSDVIMWSIPIGYSISDMLEREIPITWTNEQLVSGFAVLPDFSQF
jgi:hypothetical protein